MDLSESQESENSGGSGVKLDDTSDSNNKGQSGFSGDENLSSQFGLSLFDVKVLVFLR